MPSDAANRPFANVASRESHSVLSGRRLAVWGVPGAGKSSLARHVGSALDLEVVELDAIRHARGWDSVAWPEAARQLEQRLEAAGGGFVVDGHYTKLHSVYLPRIDTLVWMPMPLRVTLPRLLRRSIERARSAEGAYGPGSGRETWRHAFFSHESILWYALTTHRANVSRRSRMVERLRDQVEVIPLRTVREVDRFAARIRT